VQASIKGGGALRLAQIGRARGAPPPGGAGGGRGGRRRAPPPPPLRALGYSSASFNKHSVHGSNDVREGVGSVVPVMATFDPATTDNPTCPRDRAAEKQWPSGGCTWCPDGRDWREKAVAILKCVPCPAEGK